MRIERRPKFLDDLADAYAWIAPDNEAAAERLLDLVETTIDRVSRFPHIGAPREALGPGLRSIRVRPFRVLLFYRAGEDAITLIRLMHGAQDITGKSFED